MAIYNLDIYSEEHFDFDVFSITSNESIYRVINELNQTLNTDFQLNDLLDFTYKERENFYFPLYTFVIDELNIELNLLANNTSFQPSKTTSNKQNFDLFGDDIEKTIKLLPELENTDYFLLIKGDNRYEYNHLIFNAIKDNSLFMAVHRIFIDNIKDKKSRSNLLF